MRPESTRVQASRIQSSWHARSPGSSIRHLSTPNPANARTVAFAPSAFRSVPLRRSPVGPHPPPDAPNRPPTIKPTSPVFSGLLAFPILRPPNPGGPSPSHQEPTSAPACLSPRRGPGHAARVQPSFAAQRWETPSMAWSLRRHRERTPSTRIRPRRPRRPTRRHPAATAAGDLQIIKVEPHCLAFRSRRHPRAKSSIVGPAGWSGRESAARRVARSAGLAAFP